MILLFYRKGSYFIVRQFFIDFDIDEAPVSSYSYLFNFNRYFPNITLMTRSTILIVDDDPDVLNMMRLVLEDAGHTIITGHDGNSALAASKRYGRPVDVLISDVVLPGSLGPQIAEQLYEEYPNLSVIFITGFPFKQIAADIAPVPHDMLLMKPIRIGSLVSDVEKVLEKSRKTKDV